MEQTKGHCEISGRIDNGKTKALERLRILKARELKTRLKLIEDEINRINDGIRKEVDGIESDASLNDSQKKQRIGKVLQTSVIKPEMISLMMEISDRLDKLTFRRIL